MTLKIAFIGFGEAGQSIAGGLIDTGADIAPIVWDILMADAAAGEAMRATASRIGARVATSASDAVGDADLVVSAVTTDQSLVAARQIAPALAKGVIYLDLNSTSPGKKQQVAEVIEAVGAHMVEAAVMDMVPPHAHKVPLLLAGPKAPDVVALITPFGMRAEALEGGIGKASTIKMCRSVFMKGLSAIMMECAVAADSAGATDDVFASIGKTYPGIDWKAATARTLAGLSLHAGRRAGEMREVAVTLRELGVEPIMSQATADRLQDCADTGIRALAEARPQATLEDFLDDERTARARQAKAAE